MTTSGRTIRTSLCEALIQRPASGVLEQLERSNVFVVPLDDNGRWYRFHHLFGRMLHSELMRQSPDQIAVLHRRASAWYCTCGLYDAAHRYARRYGLAVAQR